MTGIQPQTIFNDVIEKLNVFRDSLKHYARADDLRIARIESDIKKLMGVDAFSAHTALGALYQTTGDCEKMRYHFKNAGRIGNRIEAMEQETVGETALGFFSHAQALFKQVANPETGHFTKAYRLGPPCGAFQLLNDYTDRAEQLKIGIGMLDTEGPRRAARILHDAGVSDADVAAMLDLAGEVMRENRVMNTSVKVTSNMHERCVYMTINLPCDAEETATMFDQLADRIAERIDPIPSAFYVSFRPSVGA